MGRPYVTQHICELYYLPRLLTSAPSLSSTVSVFLSFCSCSTHVFKCSISRFSAALLGGKAAQCLMLKNLLMSDTSSVPAPGLLFTCSLYNLRPGEQLLPSNQTDGEDREIGRQTDGERNYREKHCRWFKLFIWLLSLMIGLVMVG